MMVTESQEPKTSPVRTSGDGHRRSRAGRRLLAGAGPGVVRAYYGSIAAVLTDACLADCITELGDNSDNPSTDELKAVLPGIVERHGVASTRIMLAATVAGEAPASASRVRACAPTAPRRAVM